MHDERQFRRGILIAAVSVAVFIFLSNFIEADKSPIVSHGFLQLGPSLSDYPYIIYIAIIQAISVATAIIGAARAVAGFRG
jgi:hypothetical protein